MKSDCCYNLAKLRTISGSILRLSGKKRVVRIAIVLVFSLGFALIGAGNIFAQKQSLRSGNQSIQNYSDSTLTDYLDELEQVPVKTRKTSRGGSSFSESASPALLPVISPVLPNKKDDSSVHSEKAPLPFLVIDEEPQERIIPKESPAPVKEPAVVNPPKEQVKEQTLVNYQSPVIDIRTSGPSRIVVGQESEYLIHVRNIGGSSAQGLVVTTDIPGGVEVLGIQPSNGSAQMVSRLPSITASAEDSVQKCRWQLTTLPSQKEELLRLRLVPRQKVYFELTSQYVLAVNPIRAGVQVDEAILSVAIVGDETIHWGTEQQYQLIIQNSGNAAAENVILSVATGEGQEAMQPIGNIAPGEEKSIELAMRTEQADRVTIGVKTQGAYGVGASQAREITVLRGNLEILLEAPELQFVENEIDCFVHVANTGSAPVENATVRVRLPRELELSVGSEGVYRLNDDEPAWNLPSLAVGAEVVYQFSCRGKSPGVVAIQANAADDTGLTATGDTQIQLDAIARLHVELKSPTAPVALGTPFVYEVILTNQGSKSAQNIQSSLMLAHSLEAVGIEGGGSIVPHSNEVQFNEINFLAPGQSAIFKVEVVSHETGNIKAQAIMESVSESIRLAGEAVVYCYEKRNLATNGSLQAEKLALGPSLPRSTTPTSRQTVARTAEQLIGQNSKPKLELATSPSSSEVVQVNKGQVAPVAKTTDLPELPELQPMLPQKRVEKTRF